MNGANVDVAQLAEEVGGEFGLGFGLFDVHVRLRIALLRIGCCGGPGLGTAGEPSPCWRRRRSRSFVEFAGAVVVVVALGFVA